MKFFQGGGSLTRLIWFALGGWGWGSEAQKFDIHVEEKFKFYAFKTYSNQIVFTYNYY